MAVEITWINHASFRLADGQAVVYIDPWKIAAQPHDADMVFVSHSHYDHFNPEDVARVSSEATTVLASADVAAELPAARAISPDQSQTVGPVTIQAVAAYNIGKKFHPQANQWCGAVITLGSRRIYYAGDTDQIPEMNDLGDIDLAMLPIGGTYTMTADEATEACKAIGCAAAIGYHWGDIVGDISDAETFKAQAPCPVTILQPGETLTIDH
ncbi:MAG: MBL fold metallo-hydrolase [Phycisphaerae bacterium]|nr:MBL fold metallo-hydrolase [Phycisphaerae bacterium]